MRSSYLEPRQLFVKTADILDNNVPAEHVLPTPDDLTALTLPLRLLSFPTMSALAEINFEYFQNSQFIVHRKKNNILYVFFKKKVCNPS